MASSDQALAHCPPRWRTARRRTSPRVGGWGWRGANFKLDLSLSESVRLRSLLKISRGTHPWGATALGGRC